MDPSVARDAWLALEPIHAAIYFAPEARDAFTSVGLKGFWMGYFASRAAALGHATPELVTATFYGFHQRMVRKAIPDAWSLASPEAVLAARYDAADRMLARLLGDDPNEIDEAAALATEAAQAADVGGRALFAAHAALPWPTSPRLQLWHAATLLREHRGDGHVIALAAAGLDGCAAHVVAAASRVADRTTLQPNRGYTDDEWAAAAQQVEGREAELRAEVEAHTDRLAFQPYAALGASAVDALLAATRPLADRILSASAIPMPNPMGLPSPSR